MATCILEHCKAEGTIKKLFFWVQGSKHKYNLYAEGVPMCPTCRGISETGTQGGKIVVTDFAFEPISKLPPSTTGAYYSPVKLLQMAFRRPNAPKSAFLR